MMYNIYIYVYDMFGYMMIYVGSSARKFENHKQRIGAHLSSEASSISTSVLATDGSCHHWKGMGMTGLFQAPGGKEMKGNIEVK